MAVPPHGVSRRTFLKGALAAAALTGPLAACARGADATTLRFYQSKPEVVGYFADTIIAPFNASQDAIRVSHDSTTSLVASLVREDPHDLVCNNYDNTAGTFVARDVLTDLEDLPAAARVQPEVQALVGQYATPDRATHVLPYSVTAAGVIYNEALFAEHGVEVPTTWAEMQAACETFQAVDGVTPIYMTLRDPWTIQQGLFDYTVGGMIDVAGFFSDLQAAGVDGGTAGSVNFRDTFAPIVARMLEMLDYANPDAASRAYFDGNTAFAQGDVAMYFQGPWAIGEISNANPDLPTRTFPLPASDDAADLAARVNLDLALWIPRGAAHPDHAATFIDYLMQPEVQVTYNNDNLAFTPIVDAPPVEDERIAGLQTAIDEGRFYQGAGTYIPNSIPTGNYLQEMVLSRNGDQFLETLDADWNRLATRIQA